MRIGLRLALLMLVVMCGVQRPPAPPPGYPPGKPVRPEPCPCCGHKSVEKSGTRYYCGRCRRYFTPGEKC